MRNSLLRDFIALESLEGRVGEDEVEARGSTHGGQTHDANAGRWRANQ